jgi:hypothetical protein
VVGGSSYETIAIGFVLFVVFCSATFSAVVFVFDTQSPYTGWQTVVYLERYMSFVLRLN